MRTVRREGGLEEIRKRNGEIEEWVGKKGKWFGGGRGRFKEERVKVGGEEGMERITWRAEMIEWEKR